MSGGTMLIDMTDDGVNATMTPSMVPSASFVPTLVPTPAPTPAPILNLLDKPSNTIADFDLSTDRYKAGRIPGIVIVMALVHVVVFVLIWYLRRKEPSFFPPRKKPLSGKDRDRHVIAKCFLLGGTFLSWIFAMLTATSCRFATVGAKYASSRNERVAFGLFRAEDEDGLCAPMPEEINDNPARALVASRVFAIASIILLGLAFWMVTFLVCIIPLLPTTMQERQFPIQPVQYRFWVLAISLLYASIWTTLYIFFFFGLEICIDNSGTDVASALVPGQTCERASAKLAIYNAVLMIVTVAVGIWYLWDALTPRLMTEKARTASMLRSNSKKLQRQNSSKRQQRPPYPGIDGGNGDYTETAHSVDEEQANNNDASQNKRNLNDPISPKLPSHKNSVKKELEERQRQQQQQQSPKKSPRKSPNSTNGRRASVSHPDETSSTKSPGGNGAGSNNNNGSSSTMRSPRPGTKRSASAPSVTGQQQQQRPSSTATMKMSNNTMKTSNNSSLSGTQSPRSSRRSNVGDAPATPSKRSPRNTTTSNANNNRGTSPVSGGGRRSNKAPTAPSSAPAGGGGRRRNTVGGGGTTNNTPNITPKRKPRPSSKPNGMPNIPNLS